MNTLLELKISKEQVNDKFRLEIKVERYENIQAEIFVFKLDEFSHIATPLELSLLSKYNPGQGEVFFLDHTLILDFENATMRNDAELMILADVKKLKENWEKVYDQLNTSYTVII